MLLSLDTSSPTSLVALSHAHELLAVTESDGTGGHERVLLPMVEQVLDVAGVDRRDLEAIVCGVGPGPFTGLRVGLVTALTLGRVLGIEVTGVCSLDIVGHEVVAQGSALGADFAVATDARRREVYWATYDASGTRTSGPFVTAPAVAADELHGLAVAGPGPHLYPQVLELGIEPTRATAAGLAALAESGAARLEPAPMYLRDPDAVAPGRRKRVTPQGVGE